jgi:hypothetical protein
VKPLAVEEIGRIAWCIEATFRALKSGDHESAMYNVRYCDQGAATEIARLEWAVGARVPTREGLGAFGQRDAVSTDLRTTPDMIVETKTIISEERPEDWSVSPQRGLILELKGCLVQARELDNAEDFHGYHHGVAVGLQQALAMACRIWPADND